MTLWHLRRSRVCPTPTGIWWAGWRPGSICRLRELAELPPEEIDQHIPGARVAYENREQIAAELLRRRGIDPTSAEYRAAAAEARHLLDQIDQLGSGHSA
jgi:hypothetical protein